MNQYDFDDYLLLIAQKKENIKDFLNVIFDFLKRRTDFFHIMQPTETVGFPPGEAKFLLNKLFDAYAAESSFKSCSQPFNSFLSNPVETKMKSFYDEKGNNSKQKPDAIDTIKENNSLLTLQRISTLNGGKTNLFWWNQTLEELTLDFQLPHPILSKDHITVEITQNTLRIAYVENKGDPKSWLPLLEKRQFLYPILVSETLWYLENLERILIHIEKEEKQWWSCVFQKDPTIAMHQLQNVRKFQDLTSEEKANIHQSVLLHSKQL